MSRNLLCESVGGGGSSVGGSLSSRVDAEQEDQGPDWWPESERGDGLRPEQSARSPPPVVYTGRGVLTTGRTILSGLSTRLGGGGTRRQGTARPTAGVSVGGHSQMHDVWLDVERRSPRRPNLPLARQQVATAAASGGAPPMTDRQRKEYLAELRQQRERHSKGYRYRGGSASNAGKEAREAQQKDKPAAVGSVGTSFVYALTCPQGKKYVGKTTRTLTQRTGNGAIDGCRLIREAIVKNGGVGAFKTEVLVCCMATALEANERLYIESLKTVHPKGYNEDDDGDEDGGFKGATEQYGRSRHSSGYGRSDRAATEGRRYTEGADGNGSASGPFCSATAKTGKEFLDAAMGGRIDDLGLMLMSNESLIHFRGMGLGQSALHWAASKGHAKATAWLLSKGALVDTKNNNGSTPLHAAAAGGHTETALKLLEAGASITERDDEGRSCEQLAESRGHEELAVMLRRKHFAVTDAATAASNAAAAAYAAAAADRRDTIPIISPVEKVIAEGLVSLAIAEDILGTEPEKEVAALKEAAAADGKSDKQLAKKNSELEVQLGKVERKLRLDRLYASRPPKVQPRVFY